MSFEQRLGEIKEENREIRGQGKGSVPRRSNEPWWAGAEEAGRTQFSVMFKNGTRTTYVPIEAVDKYKDREKR